jgi:hypothetical protein
VGVAADVHPKKIEPLGEVHDLRLVFVEDKTPGFQPLGELRLDLLRLPLAMAERDHVIGVSDHDRAARHRVTRP